MASVSSWFNDGAAVSSEFVGDPGLGRKRGVEGAEFVVVEV